MRSGPPFQLLPARTCFEDDPPRRCVVAERRHPAASFFAAAVLTRRSRSMRSSSSVGGSVVARSSATRNSQPVASRASRSEEHTSELQSRQYLVCRLLLEKKNLL